jgi:hypothetical protein
MFLIADAIKAGAIAHPTLQPVIDTDQQRVNATLFSKDERTQKISVQFGFKDLYLVPVTLNVLDKEDVIIVRSCIPGNVARDICFWLS